MGGLKCFEGLCFGVQGAEAFVLKGLYEICSLVFLGFSFQGLRVYQRKARDVCRTRQQQGKTSHRRPYQNLVISPVTIL